MIQTLLQQDFVYFTQEKTLSEQKDKATDATFLVAAFPAYIL